MPKFKFCLAADQFEPIEGQPHTYKIPAVVTEAPTVEEAWALAQPQIPEGHRLFCWYETS